MTLPVAIIVAVARNRVIGADNKLLWRLKTDLRHFKALTTGKPLVMGRKTFDSIGRALPGRETIVVTRSRSFSAPGVHVAHDLAEALEAAQRIGHAMGASEIMIGGGGEIYAAAMPLAQRLYVTSVELEPDGDAHFPIIPTSEWKVVKKEDHSASVDDEAAFSFIEYDRL